MLHHYCLFYKNDKINYGWIKEIRKNRLVVIPQQGKEIVCPASQCIYIWEDKLLDDQSAALKYIEKQITFVESLQNEIDLKLIHELSDPEEAYTIEDLAENFLDSPENGWERVALLIAVKQDGQLFKNKKEIYHARTEEELEKIIKEAEQKAAQKKKLEVEKNWAEELILNKTMTVLDEDKALNQDFINRLTNFAIHLDNSQEKKYFVDLFRLKLDELMETDQRLINCLKLAGKKISWGKLQLLRSGVGQGFNKKSKEEAEEISRINIWESFDGLETKDQRDLDCYTVDQASTQDYDDALSWEKIDSGYIIRIHIADVASFIKPEQNLFEEAFNKISSVYTLKDTFPMLPRLLSENLFSLVEQEDRASITYEFELDQNFDRKNFQIYRSIINVNKNLTYNEVNNKIEQKAEFWEDLYQFCLKEKDIRINNGALDIQRSDINLDISNPEEIKLYQSAPNTPSQILIQELAILANSKAAEFCSENQIPTVYRIQPPYTITKEPEEGEKMTMKNIMIKPARLSLEADNHSGLGLEYYIQVTSPIRRFLDLVCQRSLLLKLSNSDESLEEEKMLIWSKRGEELQREYNRLERELTNHWKYKFIAQNMDQEFSAQFTRYMRNGKALISLPEVGLNCLCVLPDLENNEEFTAIIKSVDTKLHLISLQKKESINQPEEKLTEE